MKRFLFCIALFLVFTLALSRVQADPALTTDKADGPLTWLKPPATAEELKMYETLKDDPDRVQDFVKMRMIFRILGYPTEAEHANAGRKDGVIQNLILPEIHPSDMDYVFNKDEQVLRYQLNITRSQGSGMGLSELAKVILPPPDTAPLSGDVISQWNQILSDVGKAGGKPVTWEVCITGDGIVLESFKPVVWALEGCLLLKNASGEKQCSPGYPVHLEVTLSSDGLGAAPPVDQESGEDFIRRFNPKKLGLVNGNKIQIIDGIVYKNLFKSGIQPARPFIQILKYEPVN